jgi:hypothetical protein
MKSRRRPRSARDQSLSARPKTAICCVNEKNLTAYVCLNTLRALVFFVSLQLTIFVQPADFEFFNNLLIEALRDKRRAKIFRSNTQASTCPALWIIMLSIMSAVITATIKFASLGALLYMGLCALLFLFQRSLIYLPHPPSNHERETLTIPVNGAQILVTTRLSDTPKAVLYFGGNAEDVAYSLPTFEAAFPGHALYLPHYRGYGGSTGKPNEAALFADGLALFDMVHEKHPHVVVVGRSLGSAVAVHVASLRPATRLVLVTPFDSILGLAQKLYPFFPVRWLLLDRFESAGFAPKVTAPTVLIVAEMDEIVPRQSAEDLLGRFAPGVAEMKIIAAAGHNTISRSPDYIPLLQGTR